MDNYRSLEESQPRICLPCPHNGASSIGGTSDESLVDMLLSRLTSVNPYAFHLAKVPWAVFGTLTWQRDAATTATAEALRRKDFWWLIALTCCRLRLRPRRLAIYRKTEWGRGNRGHCNFLIAQRGIEPVSPVKLAEALQDTWTLNRKDVLGLSLLILIAKSKALTTRASPNSTHWVKKSSRKRSSRQPCNAFSARTSRRYRANCGPQGSGLGWPSLRCSSSPKPSLPHHTPEHRSGPRARI